MGRVKPESIANGVVFGNNNIPMVSTSAAAYTEKERQQTNSALKHTSTLVLGGKQEPMKTINQHYFDEKPILKNTLP